ncbi:MAG: SurA N-terminal domain-containing protein, partial [Acidobacteriota bacterium]
MLETLRRNVRKLSWTLWLVIVAFIVLYIPNLVRSPGNVVARVDGDPIYVSEYQQALQQQADYYRGLNQGELPDDFLQQVQVKQLVLDSLIRRKLMLAAARDQG